MFGCPGGGTGGGAGEVLVRTGAAREVSREAPQCQASGSPGFIPGENVGQGRRLDMPKVAVVRAKEELERSFWELFEPFGGARDLLGGREEVFIKVNAVDFKPHCHTDPRAVHALVRLLRSEGAKRVFVMDNCTQGNFTRLVFRVSGLERATKEAGGIPLYLDEGRQDWIELPRMGYRVKVSRVVRERLMEGQDGCFYLNMPRLKTHSMAQVTLGVKNQLGLIRQKDRIRDHNHRLHLKLADIYSVIRPHFTLIEGLEALNHGHYSPEGLAGQCVEELGLFIGGEDTLAVDAVGCHVMGIDPRQVEHLRWASEFGLGCIDLEEIEVVGDLEPFRRNYTWELLPVYPPDVKILEGRERCCPEGCNLNTRMVLQMLYIDFGGRGGFTIVMGSGWEKEDLEGAGDRVLVVGDCAVSEAYPVLKRRVRGKGLRAVRGCNNLRGIIGGLASFMGVQPSRMVPLPFWQTATLLASALWHRTTARVTPVWVRRR
jgi:uncharacterized protein (DUF362 family)